MSKLDTNTILPVSWSFVPLKELGDWSGGGTPSKAKPQYWQGGTIPWVSPKDMKTERISDSEDHITKEAVSHSATSLINAGSVLIVTRSGILRHTLPVAVNSVPVTVNQDLKALTPRNNILAEYVAWALRAFSRDILHTCSKQGTTVNSVETSKLLGFEIPVAPRSQQAKIVAEIEKQFSRLDEAIANLKRVKANLKRYKASVLKAAVEGRLVPTEAELASSQGRSYETGDQLLHRSLDVRRNQSKGKFTMPAGPIVRDLPELPAGWIWASAIQACDPVVDCHNKTAPYTNAGIPLVRTTNIRDGRLVFEDLRYVDQSTYEYWSRRCPPQPGDVLFTREAPMGEAGIIPPGLQLCLGQRTMLMRPFSAISAGFLLASLLSPVVKGLIDRVAVGSGVKHLRVGDVERLPIPLPPLVEQHRIVAEVDRRLSVIDELEAAVEVNLTRADRLRQSILSQAFSGRLLGQDTKHIQDILPTFSIAAESQEKYGRDDRARR